MHRTQIYLGDEQETQLAARARQLGRSRSDLIREAIDRYLQSDTSVDSPHAVAQFRVAVLAAAGSAPDLPSGRDYVAGLRSVDEARRHEDQSHR
jgi:hypothetical protein